MPNRAPIIYVIAVPNGTPEVVAHWRRGEATIIDSLLYGQIKRQSEDAQDQTNA